MRCGFFRSDAGVKAGPHISPTGAVPGRMQFSVPSIHAIIVTYNPDPALLERLLAALAPQVMGGVVVNNGTHLPLPDCALQTRGFELVTLMENRGIAFALNAGFEWACRHGAEFIVTFDQDSEPAPDMVARLVQAWQTLAAQGVAVGAIGPEQEDSRTTRRAAFIAPIRWARDKLSPADGQTAEVDHLITSGCLTTAHAWHQAGPFLDDLFIDYVDIEWCLRLRHNGLRVFGLGGAILYHAMGDNVKDWRGQQIPHHSPLRHYYLMRNGAYLLRLSHIPFAWKASDALHIVKKFIYFALHSYPRWPHTIAMLRGLIDGLRSRMGPADSR